MSLARWLNPLTMPWFLQYTEESHAAVRYVVLQSHVAYTEQLHPASTLQHCEISEEPGPWCQVASWHYKQRSAELFWYTEWHSPLWLLEVQAPLSGSDCSDVTAITSGGGGIQLWVCPNGQRSPRTAAAQGSVWSTKEREGDCLVQSHCNLPDQWICRQLLNTKYMHMNVSPPWLEIKEIKQITMSWSMSVWASKKKSLGKPHWACPSHRACQM